MPKNITLFRQDFKTFKNSSESYFDEICKNLIGLPVDQISEIDEIQIIVDSTKIAIAKNWLKELNIEGEQINDKY